MYNAAAGVQAIAGGLHVGPD